MIRPLRNATTISPSGFSGHDPSVPAPGYYRVSPLARPRRRGLAFEETLRTLGTFAPSRGNDLAQHRYAGDRARLDRDVRRLGATPLGRGAHLPGRFSGRSLWCSR